MNLEADYGIRYKLDYVNEKLTGKTIQKVSSDSPTRAYLSFGDGSIGMIEVLNEAGKEPYLAIMPPPVYKFNINKEQSKKALAEKWKAGEFHAEHGPDGNKYQQKVI